VKSGFGRLVAGGGLAVAALSVAAGVGWTRPVTRLPRIELVGLSASPTTVRRGQTVTFRFVIRNDSREGVFAGWPRSGTRYLQGQAYTSKSSRSARGAVRVALGTMRGSGARYPYRWGPRRALWPGRTTVVIGPVRMREPGTYRFGARIERVGQGFTSSPVRTVTVRVR
jgi:hypothetical protein